MWNLSKAAYYGDWFTVPILGLIALLTDVLYHGLSAVTPLAFALGVFVWTFAEYAIHRWAFHRLYRREHWVHHIAPDRYVGVPAWQTGGLFTVILGACWGSFGLDFGGGFFLGVAGGYLAFIWMHDQFHHGFIITSHYLLRREAAHRLHHDTGKEVNFGLVTPLWDMLLRTAA